MRHFWGSIAVTLVGLGLAFWKGGAEAVFICSVLAVMEVSLSFDNAVVNAAVLKHMTEFWRRMFLTVGMLIAVFGMRLLLPVAIVALASGLGYIETAQIAINDPVRYGMALHAAAVPIAAFGGMFLMLVFLNFAFDPEREIHWLGGIERRLARVGKVDTAAAVLSLIILLVFTQFVPDSERTGALVGGLLGVLIYLGLEGIQSLTQDESGNNDPTVAGAVDAAKRAGLAAFFYLEVLDASFSLDGVVGAFAISKDVLVIMVGLAIGAMFVRSLTIYLVKQGTLDELIFLEHGAHWAIGALAVLILVGGTGFHIPEWVTGLASACIIGLSALSSLRHAKKAAAAAG